MPRGQAARRAHSERGVTLVEVTIVVLAIAILAGAAAPTMSRTVDAARLTRARSDEDAIKTAIQNFFTATTDLGNYTGFTNNGTTGGTTITMLVGDGDIPSGNTLSSNDGGGAGVFRWDDVVTSAAPIVDFMEAHLVTNTPIGGGSYPLTGSGTTWRGAYINAPIDPDPWGNRYAVNTKWLRDTSRSNDVIVHSAGPDEQFSTLFEKNGITPGVDDIIVVIRRDINVTVP